MVAPGGAGTTTGGSPDTTGRLVQGMCGWGSPHQHLSVYPTSCKSAEDRLEVYSRHFGCVEVDSSTYAIPPPAAVSRWVARTPPGFVFLVKSFGAFCASTVDVASLPRSTRHILGLLPEDDNVAMMNSNNVNNNDNQQQQQQQLQKQQQPQQRVSYASMAEEAKADLWSRFHASLAPIKSAGKLGCVLFQFHLSFQPSSQSRAHVESLRRRLDGAVKMAVEFRNRDWVVGAAGDATAAWCRERGLALVAADELHHETMQGDRNQRGLPPGKDPSVLVPHHTTQSFTP